MCLTQINTDIYTKSNDKIIIPVVVSKEILQNT